jgi:DNA-3-methyladenine glycosylase
MSAPAARVDQTARRLLGWRISGHGVTVRITEVEAYGDVGTDQASHAHRGLTGRNAVMFGPAGFAYVYFTYGMHWCLNVVCGPVGQACAVLLRAGEVTAGVDLARSRRPAVRADAQLARGPARLATVLGAGKAADGTDMFGDGPLRLRPPTRKPDPAAVRAGPRVGITVEVDRQWRFWLADSPSVSTFRAGSRRSRLGVAATNRGESGP